MKKRNIRKDGNIYYRKPTFVLCTHHFSEEENIQICDWFKKRYMVDAKISYGTKSGLKYVSLKFNADDTKKIYSIIRPYVNQIESMKKKFEYIENYY